ncbi:hypothetical protein K449DRAFT_391569 [Hypoxylon sp. EC38]|nr:hypothetical protein K449DRAFT_391569 [Hypoxylon sp. EC38]
MRIKLQVMAKNRANINKSTAYIFMSNMNLAAPNLDSGYPRRFRNVASKWLTLERRIYIEIFE